MSSWIHTFNAGHPQGRDDRAYLTGLRKYPLTSPPWRGTSLQDIPRDLHLLRPPFANWSRRKTYWSSNWMRLSRILTAGGWGA